jgi:hypothetical protein
MPFCASKAWNNFTRSSATVFHFSSIVVTQPVPIGGNTRVTVPELGNFPWTASYYRYGLVQVKARIRSNSSRKNAAMRELLSAMPVSWRGLPTGVSAGEIEPFSQAQMKSLRYKGFLHAMCGFPNKNDDRSVCGQPPPEGRAGNCCA